MEELPGGPYEPPWGPPLWSDVAVIDFDPYGTCNQTPGFWTGYSPPGYSYNEYKYAWSSSVNRLLGYDGRSAPYPPGVNTDPNKNFAPPTIIERTEYGAIRAPMAATGEVADLLLHAMDSVPGSSGSGVRTQLFLADGDPTSYWVGPHTGPYDSSYCPTGFGDDGHCNRAPRLEEYMLYFIQASTTQDTF